MKQRLPCVLLLVSWLPLFAFHASAQEAEPVRPGRWAPVGPRGMEIRAIAVNPAVPSIFYVATWNGVYETTQEGKPWIPLTIDLPDLRVYALTVDRSIPSSLYAGVLGGVYKSRNGGRSWSVALRELTDPPFFAVLLQPGSSTTLYIGSRYGVSKTTSGGEEGWEEADAGINDPVKLLAADPAAAKTLYAGTITGGLYRSTDAGASWANIGKGLPQSAATAFAASPASSTILLVGHRGRGVSRSTDGGAHWTPAGEQWAGLTVRSVVFDPAAPATVFAATETAGVLRSTDSGASWSAFTTGMTDTDVRFLTVVPGERGESRLFAGTSQGLWVVGPASAARATPALPAESEEISASRFVRALALDPRSPSTLYAGTAGNGVFKSTDRGSTWVHTNLTGAVASLLVTPGANPAVYAGTRGKIQMSENGGKNWRVSLTDMADPYFFTIAANPKTPSVLYEGTEYGVSKSTDRGFSWDSGGTEDPKNVQVLRIDPSQPSTLFAGTDGGGVFKSTDSGKAWQAINQGLANKSVTTLALDPKAGAAILYAGTDGGGVFRSGDGGKSWQPLMSAGMSRAPVTALGVHPQATSTIFAGIYGGGLYRSTDSGKSWNAVNNGMASLRIRALAIDPSQPSSMWAGTDGGGLYATSDGGSSWRAQNLGEPAGATEVESLETLDYESEVQKYSSEAENDPNDSDAQNNLGISYYAMGDLQDAEEHLERALSLDPQGEARHSNLGFVRFDQGRARDALELFEQELEMFPDHDDAFAGKAICLQALGKSGAALEAYGAAVERDHNYLDSKILRSSYYWSENACKAAQPLIDKLLK